MGHLITNGIECIQVSAADYSHFLTSETIVYQSVAFNELNASKVSQLRYLLFKRDGKAIAGLIVGEKGNVWLSPFSAPFAGFSFSKSFSLTTLDSIVSCLFDYIKKLEIVLQITMPPLFYKQDLYLKLAYVLQRYSTSSYTDINYALDLKTDDYDSILISTSRRHLNRAKSIPYVLKQVDTLEEKKLAYDVIAQNYKAKGYPLKMSLNDLEKTMTFIHGRYFLLSMDEIHVASAIVYEVTPTIAQLIYWGDLSAYSLKRPMNLLAAELFEIYKKRGFEFLDIGPASELGAPNTGLCSFKESIGCFADLKYHFTLKGNT
ncbi:MAG TPA: hypothetical protein PLT31_00840 [Fibrobacteraceae bacterium]|jgi:hypothetical protein|nr:hypothetical protein [Fibrobacteraceae bacterium]